MRAPHGTWRRLSSVRITTQTQRDTSQREDTACGMGERERAHMKWLEAANAARPELKAVHSILALLTCISLAVAMLVLHACVEEASRLGDRRGAVQRHTVLQHGQCTHCAG